MARFNDDPDIELVGCLVDNGSAKAYHFQPDFGQDEPIWVPRSQADWIPDPDRSEEKGGTLMIRAWIAKKEGWDKA